MILCLFGEKIFQSVYPRSLHYPPRGPMTAQTLPLRCPRSHQSLRPLQSAEVEEISAALPLSAIGGAALTELTGGLTPLEAEGERIFYPLREGLYHLAPADACRWPG